MTDEEKQQATRDVLEAMAYQAWYTHSSTLGGTLEYYSCCPFEECEQESLHGPEDIQHKPDCPVIKARAVLAAQ